MPKSKIYMVAVDGSEWGERAADRAINLAAETGASILLATVIPWSGYQPISLQELAMRPHAKEEEEQHAKENILAPIMAKHAKLNVPMTTVFDWGDPTKVIREMAKKHKVNMVFVGRRGRSKISDLILGSVANALAHSLGVPIVLVP